MVTPLHPVPGDPDAVRSLAAAMAGTGGRLDAIAATLLRLRDGATWQGCAGDAFGARVGDVPPVLRTVAGRFSGAVAPLRELADALEEVQRITGQAVRVDDEAASAYAALEERVITAMAAGSGEDDPHVLVLRHCQREQVQQQQEARSRHTAALHRFREVDARVTRVLRSLSLDDIADSAPYRLLATVSTGGRDLAAVGMFSPVAPELAPVAAVADAGATLADAGLLLAYGEGDAGALALDAALAATGGVGSTLRRGATVGAEVTASGARVTRQLTAQQRLAIGAVETVRAKRDALVRVPGHGPPAPGAAPRVPAPTSRLRFPTGTPIATRVAAHARRGATQVRESAHDALRRKVLDDWARASANGPQAQRMYAAGVTLEQGSAQAARRVQEGRTEREGGGR